MAKFSQERFNPTSATDISDFLKLLFDLYLKGTSGANQAVAMLKHLAETKEGRILIHNAHRVVSAQMNKMKEPKLFSCAQSIQKVTAMFGRGGS